jgi:hypothetical protein
MPLLVLLAAAAAVSVPITSYGSEVDQRL